MHQGRAQALGAPCECPVAATVGPRLNFFALPQGSTASLRVSQVQEIAFTERE